MFKYITFIATAFSAFMMPAMVYARRFPLRGPRFTAATPECSSVLLFGVGLVVLMLLERFRKRKGTQSEANGNNPNS